MDISARLREVALTRNLGPDVNPLLLEASEYIKKLELTLEGCMPAVEVYSANREHWISLDELRLKLKDELKAKESPWQ